MNSVYVLAPGESWIVDRFVKEWNEDNADITTRNINDADIIWIMSDWCWRRIPTEILKRKKVITTIHHIVPQKFGISEKIEFNERDAITDIYHVPNHHTEAFVKSMTTKPVMLIPYWANNTIWKKTDDKQILRKKHKIPEAHYVIGSFQRDTEGHDLKTPKLEKGPDLLALYIEQKRDELFHNGHSLHVLLAGWRRQYIMSRLQQSGINYTYHELPAQHIVNELYQTLDEYPITARHEGGPQSLIECGLLHIPVVSRDIGMSSALLDKKSVNNDLTLTIPSIPNVEFLKLPAGYARYRELIQSL